MPVQITINGENANQAIEEFAALSAVFVGQASAPVKGEVNPRQQRKTTIETKKDEPKEEPIQAPAKGTEAKEGQTSTEEDEIPSVVDLRAKAQEVGKDVKKKPAIKKLLGQFECASISDVPEEKRIAFMEELENLL